MEDIQEITNIQQQDVATQSTNRTSLDRTSRQAKRLSLNFPILSPTATSDRQSSPSPLLSATAQSSGRSSPIKVGSSLPSPVDSTGFLTSLAAQERKVLELREELQRAEHDLSRLKRQWAQYEASKKRSEVNRVEKLQHVTKSIDDTIAEEGSGSEDVISQESRSRRPEKPKRRSQQRIFSSSRHARTLSLLSPATSSAELSETTSVQPVASPIISDEGTTDKQSQNATVLERSPEDATFAKTYRDLASRHSLPPPTKEALMKTGKQMATDLKEGFWTFFEDIRQATVGEEGINATENRSSLLSQPHATRANPKTAQRNTHLMKRTTSKELLSRTGAMNQMTSTQARRPSIQTSDPKGHDSFWKEFGLETPDNKAKQKATLHPPQKIPAHSFKPRGAHSAELEEATEEDMWDLWDSPIPVPARTPGSNSRKTTTRNSGSTIASQATSDAHAPSEANSNGSSRTSTSSVEAQTSGISAQGPNIQETRGALSNISTSIPWPEITKQLHPNRLSRTLTDMIKDWEITDPEAEELARRTESSEAGLEHLRSA